MKQLYYIVAISAVCLVTPVAEAGVFSSVGQAAVWTWNLVPKAVVIVNSGLHFLCENTHSAIHAVANYLTIQNLP